MPEARWIRIRLVAPWAERVAELFSASGADAVTVGRGGHELVARFPSPPADLVDRVEGWLTLVDPDGSAELETGEARGVWVDSWRAFLRVGTPVGRRLAVRPPWASPTPGRLDVVVDPRGGFGSGLHPSTQQALLLLERHLLPGSLLDVGAGSGVLSLACVLLGASVTAVEREPAGRAACRRGMAASGVGPESMRVEERPLEALDARFPMAAANMAGPVLLRLAPAIRAATPGGRVVLAGFRPRDLAAVRAAFPGDLIEALDWCSEDFAAAAIDLDGTAPV